MNSYQCIGTIVTEPQLRYGKDGQLPIWEAGIELPNPNPKREPIFLKVTAFGKSAENADEAGYTMGEVILVDGRVDIVSYEKEGVKSKRAEVVARSIQAIGKAAASPARPQNVVRMPKPSSSRTPAPVSAGATEVEDPDFDPIPF